MPLNNAEKSFRDKLAEANAESIPTPLNELKLDDLRKTVADLMQYAGPTPEIPTEEKLIPVRDGSQIRVHIYNSHLKDGAILVFYPGCSYIMPAFELNAIAAARIALAAEMKVAVIDFNLAPECPMPKPILDCYDVTQYIYQHPDVFGFDQQQFFIGGLSSGAHSALAISLLAKDDPKLNIARTILVNGFYDMWTRFHEPHGADWLDAEEQKDYLMPQATINYQFKQLGLSEADLKGPLLSPLLSADLSGLPPITIIIAEHDTLRTDSERLCESLTAKSTPYERILIEGQTHNTMILRGILNEGPDPSNIVAQAIKQHIETLS